jgi:hypothetical protein
MSACRLASANVPNLILGFGDGRKVYQQRLAGDAMHLLDTESAKGGQIRVPLCPGKSPTALKAANLNNLQRRCWSLTDYGAQWTIAAPGRTRNRGFRFSLVPRVSGCVSDPSSIELLEINKTNEEPVRLSTVVYYGARGDC